MHNQPSVRPDTLDKDRFAQALREQLFRKKLTQKDLAERLGVSQPTVSGWVNAQKTPGRKNLTRLLGELDLKAHEITTVQSLSEMRDPGEDALALPHISVASEESPAEEEDEDPGDDLLATLLPDAVEANPDLQMDGYVVFSRTMLRRATQMMPDDLMVVSVKGDSMAPELPDGTSAMFSRIMRGGDHGLYVILYDDALVVKTVQRFAGGAMKLTAANPAYDAEMLMPAESPGSYRSRSTDLEVSISVLGKVVCYVRPV